MLEKLIDYTPYFLLIAYMIYVDRRYSITPEQLEEKHRKILDELDRNLFQ